MRHSRIATPHAPDRLCTKRNPAFNLPIGLRITVCSLLPPKSIEGQAAYMELLKKDNLIA